MALLELVQDLSASIGGLRDGLMAEREERAARAAVRKQPVFAPQFGRTLGGGAPAVGTNGTLLLDLGSPQLGKVWDIRRVAVSDAQSWANTMHGAEALFYVGRTSSTLFPQNIVWELYALPSATTFSKAQIVLYPQDRLYCYIYRGHAGQLVTAVAGVESYDRSAVSHVAEEA
jgi:hypothetical protein